MKLRDAFKPSSPKMTVVFVTTFMDGQNNYESVTITSKNDLEKVIKDAFQGEIKLGDSEVTLQGKTAFSLTEKERENLLRKSVRV